MSTFSINKQFSELHLTKYHGRNADVLSIKITQTGQEQHRKQKIQIETATTKRLNRIFGKRNVPQLH